MKNLFNIKNEKTKMLLVVLSIGGLWGILEASLGTLFHAFQLQVLGNFILLPIAYVLLSIAYSETKKARTIFYVGLVASVMKLCVFVLPGFPVLRIVNPALSIMLEASFMAVAVYVFKPKTMFSERGIFAIIVANIVWRLVFIGYQGATEQLVVSTYGENFSSSYWNIVGGTLSADAKGMVDSLVVNNLTTSAVTVALLGIGYGINYLIASKNVNINTSKIKSFVYNPIFASCAVIVGVGLTVGLSLI